MSNYTKSTNFATKDNLTPGDPLKIVRGTEIDTEYNNIATAIATKTDNASAAITGGTITGITDLAVADGGTGASTAAGALNNLLPSQTGNANKYLQTDGTNATWDAVSLSTADITGTLPVANGGTGVTSSTGTGSVVLSNSPTLVTPALGTPASGVATNITGLPISTGVSGLGTGVATFLGTPSSANLASAVSDETGTGALVFANTPTLVTPILGTPTSGTLTNATGLPISTGVSGLGTGVATFLATPSSANLAAALTDETGSGANVFATSPTLVTPILGTPTSATLTNATGLPLTTGVTGTLPTANGGTNLTSFTSGGVVYASSSSALATGSALTFDGNKVVTNALGFNYYTGSYTVDGTISNYSAGNSLYVNGNAGGYLVLQGAGNQKQQIGISGSNTGGEIFFTSNGSESMRLTSTGLGIGTSSPATKLEVQEAGTGSSYGVISATATSGGNAGYGFKTGGTVRWFIDTIGSAGSEALRFYSSSASSQRMLLDSAGNLGLGVTPNSGWVTSKILQTGGEFISYTGTTGYLTTNTYYGGSPANFRYIGAGVASRYEQSSGIHSWHTAASGTAGDAISFTQAMTLAADGTLLVGKTSSNNGTNGAQLSPTTQFFTNTNDYIALFNRKGTDGVSIYFQKDETNVGNISVTTSATAYNTSSDYRLKDITGSITTSGAYIDSLNPVEGTWKADGSTFVGLIAHEVQEASRTQVATGTKDGAEMQAMDYSNSELIANLIAEVKSLRQRVATLEAQ